MFDIDKLGLSTINWNVKNGKASDQFEKGSEQYYQNRIIRDFITLLIDKNTPNILHRSIDNDTKLLTDIVEELEGGEAVREEPYGFYSLSTQTERKNDYITGKIGIGPFALNNNNHILTMLYGVRFKDFPGSIMSTLGLTNLGTREDADHNSIMSWISALINAHVDIAKDPYISKLNVNPYTYNLVNTLIRTGFGKNTFYFTTQPIMKELATAYMNASSSYMSDPNKTKYLLQRDAVEEVAKNRFGDLELGEYKFEDFEGINEPKNIGMRTFINNMFKQIVDNGTLRKNANGKDIRDGMFTTVLVGEKTMELSSEQILFIVYLVNEQLAPYAQSVSNLVKYSKIDTKKHGKSYIEQQLFEEGFDDLFFNPDGSGLFEEDGIRNMARDSYILTKTKNAISMTKNVLKGQFLQATNAFDKATSDILREIGRPNSKSADLNSKIVRAIMASVKSEFINNYAKELHPNNPTFIRDLVSESREEFEGMQAAGHKEISIRGKSNYSLTSYIGGTATITFNSEKSDKLKPGTMLPGGVVVVNIVQNQNDATYTFRCPVIGANDELNEITVPMIRKKSMEKGKIVLSGGKNTIFDRFNRLAVQLKDDSQYSDILDGAGEPVNMLLRSLVRGKTFNYVAPSNNYLQEVQDTYETLKFLKLFNALDQNGVESNYIIDAWDELLHDSKHPLLKEFAEDLVVYAFVTSGDQGGFTKFFKQVPFSWRKESGYGDFISDKIVEYITHEISSEQLRDTILNNWFDNDFVRTYYFNRKASDGKTYVPNFISYSGESRAKEFAPQYHPLILAALTVNDEGVYEPSIDANNAPRFIKIPRRNEENAKDSQRRYTIYEKIDNGMKQTEDGEWIIYPIYVKVEPKGNQLRDNYLMTEYGRNDARIEERTLNREGLSKVYKLGDFISRQSVEDMKNKFGENWATIIESMNYYNMFDLKYNQNIANFNKAVSNNDLESTKNLNISVTVDTVDDDGFHDDEIFGTITAVVDTSNGHLISLKIDGKTYKIKVDLNYNIVNKSSKFSDIYDYDDLENRISLKDLISRADEYVDFEEVNTQIGPEVEMDIWAGSDPQNPELSNIANRPFKLQLFEGEVPILFNSVEQAFLYTKFRLLARYLGFDTNNSKFLLSDQKLTGEDYKDNTTRYVQPGVKAESLKKKTGSATIPAIGDYQEELDLLRQHIKKIQSAKDGWDAKHLGGKNGGYYISGNSGNTFLDTIWRYGESVAQDVMKAAMKASFEQNELALKQLLATGNATLTHKKGGEWSELMPQLLMEVRDELRRTHTNNSVLLSEKEQKEAEEIKKICKGGK